MVACTLNLSTQEAKTGGSRRVWVNMVYAVCGRTIFYTPLTADDHQQNSRLILPFLWKNASSALLCSHPDHWLISDAFLYRTLLQAHFSSYSLRKLNMHNGLWLECCRFYYWEAEWKVILYALITAGHPLILFSNGLIFCPQSRMSHMRYLPNVYPSAYVTKIISYSF